MTGKKEPTDDEIMEIMGLTVTSTHQLCERLRDLFAGVDYISRPRTLQSREDMQSEVRKVNRNNGWYDDDRSPLEGHMLIVSEVSEATEAFRSWGLEDMTGKVSLDKALPSPDGSTVVEKPEGLGSEYADILIRLLDQADRDGVDLRAEYQRKIRFNKLRGYKHGGKSI